MHLKDISSELFTSIFTELCCHRVEEAAEAECYPDHDSRQDVSEVLVMPGQRVGEHVYKVGAS